MSFPYIPGLLSFRECPALVAAFKKLSRLPDLAFFDAHGIAHPRGLGEASHMGLWLKIPTVGVAKSVLVGKFRSPARKMGSWSPLLHKGKRVGAALRAGYGLKPVFISPGHLMDLRSAISLVRETADGRRIPKPTREADRWVAELRALKTRLPL